MNGPGRFDVVIVGAGAAGLWTASHLVAAGARVLVVHAPHTQGYSSTRNQGWLHSGALYAVFRAPAVTRDCIQGSERIREYAARHDPSLLAAAEFSYVFSSPRRAGAAVDACLQAGIAARHREARPGLQRLFDHPVWPVQVPDRSVDSSRLLRTLSWQLTSAGGRAAGARSLREVRLRPCGNGWNVSGEGFSASGAAVILAAGTLIPELLASAGFAGLLTARPAFEVTATTVLRVPWLSLPSAVVCIDGGPHVIPYQYQDAQAGGATLCVPFDNQPGEASRVHQPPGAAARDRVLATVQAFTPGLADALASTRRKFWYTCQKLIPAGAASRPDWRHNVFTPVAPGLYVAYAGKFTTAPVLAEHIARHLDHGWPGGPLPPGQGTVEVADQPYRAEGRPSIPPARQAMSPVTTAPG